MEFIFIYQKKNAFNNLTPQKFLSFCKEYIENTKHLTLFSITQNPEKFTDEELKIINNGIKLAKQVLEVEQIKNKIQTKSKLEIKWLGRYTQNGTPWDIIINEIPFSLKEESFVLYNMGLYQLLNILTNTNQYKKGLHVFKIFAPKEFENWFKVAKDLLVKYLKKNACFIYENKRKNKRGELFYDIEKDILYLKFKNKSEIKTESVSNFSICGYEDFVKTTSNKVREHTFSKFINNKLKNNFQYNEAKKLCAVVTGKNIEAFLKKNLEKNLDVTKLFRFFDRTYYYAKIAKNGKFEIYKIPSIKAVQNKSFKIKNVKCVVPKTQLNIITSIINSDNPDSEIVIRNELRYTHGQLNGIPEAKMYIDRKSSLSAIYEKM